MTLITVGVTIIAVCVLGFTIVTFLMFRTVMELAGRIELLTEQLRNSSLVTLGQVRTSARAVGQAAATAVRIARPMLASTMFRGAPPWLRRFSLWTGLFTAAHQVFLATTKKSAVGAASAPHTQPVQTDSDPA